MKIFTVEVTRKGNKTQYTGTLPELIQIFSYTLECGHSWNKKISKIPKTIASFIKNVNMSYEEKRDYSSHISQIN